MGECAEVALPEWRAKLETANRVLAMFADAWIERRKGGWYVCWKCNRRGGSELMLGDLLWNGSSTKIRVARELTPGLEQCIVVRFESDRQGEWGITANLTTETAAWLSAALGELVNSQASDRNPVVAESPGDTTSRDSLEELPGGGLRDHAEEMANEGLLREE